MAAVLCRLFTICIYIYIYIYVYIYTHMYTTGVEIVFYIGAVIRLVTFYGNSRKVRQEFKAASERLIYEQWNQIWCCNYIRYKKTYTGR